MLSIKELLSGNTFGLSETREDLVSVNYKECITDALLCSYNYESALHKPLLARAWHQRKIPECQTTSRKVLLAAPFFYSPLGSSGWVFTNNPTPKDLVEEILRGTIDPPEEPTESEPKKEKPTKPLSQQVLELLKVKNTPETVEDKVISTYLPIYGIIPWRKLVKSDEVATSKWFKSKTGAMVTALKVAEENIGPLSSTLRDEIVAWYCNVDPDELLNNHLAEIMICALARSTRIPLFIAESIKSGWMFHGLRTYIYLIEAARTLGLSSVELVEELCCPLLNVQIMAIINLMKDEQLVDNKVFPYVKIINTNFHNGVSNKRCIPLMYVLRQIICPCSSNAVTGPGIWGKMCGVPSIDVRKFLHKFAMALRLKYMHTAQA